MKAFGQACEIEHIFWNIKKKSVPVLYQRVWVEESEKTAFSITLLVSIWYFASGYVRRDGGIGLILVLD